MNFLELDTFERRCLEILGFVLGVTTSDAQTFTLGSVFRNPLCLEGTFCGARDQTLVGYMQGKFHICYTVFPVQYLEFLNKGIFQPFHTCNGLLLSSTVNFLFPLLIQDILGLER